MKSDKKNTLVLIFLLLVLIMSSCQPSPGEEDIKTSTQVTATAEEPTLPTPTKKPTATPVPIPSIEPDGLIVYLSIGNESNQGSDAIYFLDPRKPDSPILFSSFPYGDLYPAWSSDGQYISLTSMRYGENVDIFAYSLDGSEIIRVTDDPAVDAQGVWAPDGKRLVFVSVRDGNQELYITDLVGGSITRLTDSPGDDNDPAWSPDGKSIAFTSNRNGNFDIFLLEVEGGGLTQLTDQDMDEFRPSWSPDGNLIAFSSFINNNLDIYTMGKDGNDIQRVTFNPSSEDHATWSPEGKFLAYDSDREGDRSIYMIDLATGTESQLSSDPGDEIMPNWGMTDQEFTSQPWFGHLMCIRDVDSDFSPDEVTDSFLTSDMAKYIGFQYRNLEAGMSWSHAAISSSPVNFSNLAFWDSGLEGFYVLFISQISPEAGPLTVELSLEDEVVREITCDVIE